MEVREERQGGNLFEPVLSGESTGKGNSKFKTTKDSDKASGRKRNKSDYTRTPSEGWYIVAKVPYNHYFDESCMQLDLTEPVRREYKGLFSTFNMLHYDFADVHSFGVCASV